MVKNLTKKQLILISATFLLTLSIPLGIYLAKKQQTIKSRANEQIIECPSDSSNKQVSESCVEGFIVKEFIYKADNQCKVFLEPTVNRCVSVHVNYIDTPNATFTASPSASLPSVPPRSQNRKKTTPSSVPEASITPSPSASLPSPTSSAQKTEANPSPSASLPSATPKPQNTPAPDPADFNKDTKVNSYDYSVLIGRFGERGNLIEDLNKDGVVNSVDAALFYIAQKRSGF